MNRPSSRPSRTPKDPVLTEPEPAADLSSATEALKAAAAQLGFAPVGVAAPELPAQELERFSAWLAANHYGRMDWIAREPEARADARQLLPNAGAVLMLGLPYEAQTDPLPRDARGWVAAYAQAPLDYHRVFAARLEALAGYWRALVPGAEARRLCDTSPFLERAFAHAAGLGFWGKNTNLIHARRGSTFFLGGLIVDRPLAPDGPDPLASCGSCTRCLEVCPTDAFPEPYVLDASRCISYLTIEHRGPYPEELREGVGQHVFGCDLCQAICPWNERFGAEPDAELAPDVARRHPPLLELYEEARQSFKRLARGTPWYRAGKTSFLRNLATAMGNASDPALDAPLTELAEHEDPAVAEHARWAQARRGGSGQAGAGST